MRILASLLLLGCASFGPGSSAPPFLGDWYNPPSHFPGICLRFEPGGGAFFRGGFEYYNPSRWSYDPDARELQLTLGGTATFPVESLDYQLAHRPRSLLRIDPDGRSLSWTFVPATGTLDFGGFIFFRNRSCEAPAS